MIKISVDNQFKAIRYSHAGAVYVNDFKKAWEQLLQTEEFVKLEYDLITDFRNSDFHIGVGDIEEMSKYLSSVKPILQNKLNAVLSNNPYSTAISLLIFGRMENLSGFEVEVFSTEKAAMEWLSIKRLSMYNNINHFN